MSAEGQTKIVADYIMANVPGEPSRDEGAGDCAVRLLERYRRALNRIVSNLGVPNAGYPAPVASAYEVAKRALAHRYEVYGILPIEVCDELSGSEALWGFVGWRTTQTEETVMSGHHDMGVIATLVSEFCERNQLSEPRTGWHEKLIHPHSQEERPLPDITEEPVKDLRAGF